MVPTSEKGRKNTAAKQLPSWLRPAVPTIRKLLKHGAPNQRGIPLTISCTSIQLADDSVVDHWYALLSDNSIIIIHDNGQKINAHVR